MVNNEKAVVLYSLGMTHFTDNVYRTLANRLFREGLEIMPGAVLEETYFNSNEHKVNIPVNVRNRHVYLIHGFFDGQGKYNPDHGFIKLLFEKDALLRASADKITYVLPHMPYQRQDKRDKGKREPISIKCLLDALVSGAESKTGIITFDPHSDQVECTESVPFDRLYATKLFAEYFKKIDGAENFTVVGPDAGSGKKARYLAEGIHNNPIALVDKRRTGPGVAEAMMVVGDVNGRDCIIIDDMIDTAGTIIKGSRKLRTEGAKNIYVAATHPIFGQDQKTPGVSTEDKIRDEGLHVIVTDTIPRSFEYMEKNDDWLHILSVAGMTANAIFETHTGGSVSALNK